MHPFSIPCFQTVEKGCIGNKWVKVCYLKSSPPAENKYCFINFKPMFHSYRNNLQSKSIDWFLH